MYKKTSTITCNNFPPPFHSNVLTRTSNALTPLKRFNVFFTVPT